MPNYVVDWEDVWQEYVSFVRETPQSHPSHAFMAEVVGLNLTNLLSSLETFYGKVGAFVRKAHQANQHKPAIPYLEQELDALARQIGEKPVIRPYYTAGRLALQGLEKVIHDVAIYVPASKPKQLEVGLLTRLVAEAKQISVSLTKDLETYVTKTPETLAALRKVA